MFDSGISASALIEELRNEIDVSSIITNASYVVWLNTLEQMLYSEIIKEQKQTVITSPAVSPLAITAIVPATGEAQARFEDIEEVYADSVQLQKADVSLARVFPSRYFKSGVNIGYKKDTGTTVTSMGIIYNVRPALKTVNGSDVIQAGNVMLPYEHLDLVRAKLRAEAYKIANEFNNAANWINDYNALLEVFKEWVLSKK